MKDPIVEEVHQARSQLWGECEGDLEKLVAKLKAIENDERHRVISLERLEALRANPSLTRK